MGPQPSHPCLPPAPPQMLLPLTRPQGASRARSQGSRCRLPPSPSGAPAPGSTERLALPARQGCPPYPHSTGALPTPQGPQDTAVFQGQHQPCILSAEPQRSSPSHPKPGLQWQKHLAGGPGGRIH